jgi:hypothetical protein
VGLIIIKQVVIYIMLVAAAAVRGREVLRRQVKVEMVVVALGHTTPIPVNQHLGQMDLAAAVAVAVIRATVFLLVGLPR